MTRKPAQLIPLYCIPNVDIHSLHELNTFDNLVLVCSLVKRVSSVKHLIEVVHLLEIKEGYITV